MSVHPDQTSPALVGSKIRWFASAGETVSNVWYRFRIRPPGDSEFHLVRDYGPQSVWNWTPMDGDGAYEIEIAARDLDTGESDVRTETFQVAPLAAGGDPVITPTDNALVFIYSAPPCAAGSTIRVSFGAPNAGRRSTPPVPCDPSRTSNTYLAGMRPETEYRVYHVIQASDGAAVRGPDLTLTTGELPFIPPPTRTLVHPDASSEQRVLLQNRLFDYSIATDFDGFVIWYLPQNLQYLTRMEAGGHFFALIEDHGADDTGQMLKVLDLAGNVLLETNAARVNEQLEAMGKSRMTSFHHEARRLTDGRILVLAANERMLTDVQGPGEVNVVGDMILVLNQNLEVEWVWDAFDHLDPSRKAILDEKCEPFAGGCPVMRLSTTGNDWLHGNSLAVTPDGGILYSARHQDWIIKIDFANGNGSGAVIWRFGKDGDFEISSDDPSPWFSHQHDASLVDGNNVLLFDNGNTRYEQDSNVHSRGQVLTIDEQTRTARLTFNADLGAYALALGSAQRLAFGRYHFNLGWMPNLFSQALEFNGAGRMLSQVESETQQYRSFRIADMYTPE